MLVGYLLYFKTRRHALIGEYFVKFNNHLMLTAHFTKLKSLDISSEYTFMAIYPFSVYGIFWPIRSKYQSKNDSAKDFVGWTVHFRQGQGRREWGRECLRFLNESFKTHKRLTNLGIGLCIYSCVSTLNHSQSCFNYMYY